MSNPISVTIKNKINQGRVLNWLGQGQKWIDGNGTIEIDYEPWSCADRRQQLELVAALTSNAVELTLHVMNSAGKVIDIDYDPAVCIGRRAPVEVKKAEAPAKVVEETAKVVTRDQKSHIIVTGKPNEDALNMGFTAKEVTPPTAEEHNDGVGFTPTTPGADGVVTPVSDANFVKTESEAESTIADEFDMLMSAKKYAEAFQLLKDTFGEDKITFSQRTMKTYKTYAAIVEHFKLA